MTYEEWEEQVTPEIRKGPVWKFYGYRKALFLHDLAWSDCEYWQKERRGWSIIDQVIRSAGSISANIEEGFGRGFGRDNARFLKMAVGSARETQGWYWRGRELLPAKVCQHRMAWLDEIIALLVTEIRRQLNYTPGR
ncbi:MAG: four helix bundle protein [Anaerolineales bacterium]|nr:MAG: four helix bundle protein [Anaerolineales bacterium]